MLVCYNFSMKTGGLGRRLEVRHMVAATAIVCIFVSFSVVRAAVSTYADGIAVGGTVLSTGLLLDVSGKIGATEYCDQNGANCITAGSGNVGGSGTSGYITKFTSGTTLGNSLIQESGTNIGIGRTPAQKLDVEGNLVVRSGTVYINGVSQTLYGDGSNALYYDANHSTITQFIMRDAENTIYGRLYGSGNGSDFGLLDGDGNWAIQHNKDNWTIWRINNVEKMRLDGTGLGVINHIQTGIGSGAVAMTYNDGGGNANLTFNHTARTPDITGNAGRVEVNVDSTSNALMSFELGENLAVGVAANLTPILTLQKNGSDQNAMVDGDVHANNYCDENGNNCKDIVNVSQESDYTLYNVNVGNDSYGGWTNGTQTDTCHGNASSPYSCGTGTLTTCTDSQLVSCGKSCNQYQYRTVTCRLEQQLIKVTNP